jgi:hypothetical protein
MNLKLRQCAVVLAGLGLALPLWAGSVSASLIISQPTTIGTEKLKPGEYELRAEEGEQKLNIVRGTKVLMQVPCAWVQLPSKAEDSRVIVANHVVTEIDFSGSSSAIKFNP